MRSLFLIPFYFFGAISAFLALSIAARLLRFPARPSATATAAAALAVAAIGGSLASELVQLADFSAWWLVTLVAASFAFAAIDVLLEPRRRLPLDEA
ncbi:MAG: hypothetical protein AB7V27_13400 [Candidatus Binatia bacterium]